MLNCTIVLKKFASQGEKTGWTYLEITAKQAELLKKNNRKSFRVKGKVDKLSIHQMALIPMGGGNFIIPIKKELQKQLGKRAGASVQISIELDESDILVDPDFLEALSFELEAERFFSTLTFGHQRYFSKWIETAKTETTRTKRIAMAVNALARNMDYGAMLREQTAANKILGRR